MSGFCSQGFSYRPAIGADDPVTARLRIDQMMRAVREAAAFAGAPPPRVVSLSGQILDAGDTGGDGARIIDDGGADRRGR